MEAAVSAAEQARLDALRRYRILDTPPEREFDEITRLAAYIFDAPISLISFVDAGRVWFKSRLGLEQEEAPRDLAFCNHALSAPDIFVVPDALVDARFASNPYVVSGPRIRFYASGPLVSPGGEPLGAVCVADPRPRHPSAQQLEALCALARQVMAQLELRRSVAELAETVAGLERAEQALRRSEDQYRLLFDANPQPMWVYDAETLRFLAVNEAAIRHYGYSREEFLRRTIKDIRPPEDVPKVLDHLRDRQESLIARGTFRHRKKDGTAIDVEVASHDLTFGERSARLVLTRDITERRRAEAALVETETRYRLAARATRDMIWDWDLLTDEVKWNEGIHVLFGYPKGIERTDISWWTELLHPEDRDRVAEGIHGVIDAGDEFWSDEYRFRRADGSYANILDRGYVMHDPSGRPVRMVGAMIDHTEQKRLEEQLRHSQKMEAIGSLAGGVAHDFNNLLTAILGYCEIIESRVREDDPLRADIREIRKAGERASDLTRHLLAFSRRQVLRPKVLDLNSVVRNMERMLRPVIGEDIELRIATEPGLGHVKADPGQIEQVIMNLAVNARDAMPEGGRLRIETGHTEIDGVSGGRYGEIKPGAYVTLAVEDTGQGIDPDSRERIFEPFFTTKEMGRGTGLGLSTVYGIVKQSGGEIEVGSSPGRGSCFTIYLPRVLEALTPEPNVSTAAGPLAGTETVLLVEDEELVRNLVRACLEQNGYSVLAAGSGEEALRSAGRHRGPIDLIVTDLVLPGIQGRDLAKRLGESHSEAKTLFISGYSKDRAVGEADLEPATAFLRKPFTPAELARKVREVLGNSPRGARRGADRMAT